MSVIEEYVPPNIRSKGLIVKLSELFNYVINYFNSFCLVSVTRQSCSIILGCYFSTLCIFYIVIDMPQESLNLLLFFP